MTILFQWYYNCIDFILVLFLPASGDRDDKSVLQWFEHQIQIFLCAMFVFEYISFKLLVMHLLPPCSLPHPQFNSMLCFCDYLVAFCDRVEVTWSCFCRCLAALLLLQIIISRRRSVVRTFRCVVSLRSLSCVTFFCVCHFVPFATILLSG